MHEYLGVYSIRIFKDRKFNAFKDTLLKGLGRILSWCAESNWTIQSTLQGSPAELQKVGGRNYRSRKIIFWGRMPEGDHAQWQDVKLMETEYTPPFPRMPSRPFVMACRPLCGMDLHRIHFTCFTFCRIRKVFYGHLPNCVELSDVWSVAVRARRRNPRVKTVLMKKLGPLIEWCGN